MKICKYCGSATRDEDRFCPQCGADDFDHRCEQCGTVFSTPCCPQCGLRAGAAAKTCPNCGARYFSNACPNCGYSTLSRGPATRSQPVQPAVVQQVTVQTAPQPRFVTPAAPVVSEKSRAAALILLLLVGWLGVHRFYVGKIFSGILYLLTFGFVGVGLLVDLIMLLVGSFRDRHGLELKNW